jgi:hypothetical protein
MSIPDIDYVLGDHVGQFEYSVALSPMKPSETGAVATAVKYGEQKAQERILKELEELAVGGHLSIALFKLRKIINNDQTVE